MGAKMPALLRLADGVLSVVLAPPCAACGTPLSQPTRGPVCQECWNSIARFAPPLCNQCGDPLLSWRKNPDSDGRCARCRQHSSPVTASRAIGPYDGTLRDILHAFKYGGCLSLSRGLGELLRESAAEILAAVRPGGARASAPYPAPGSGIQSGARAGTGILVCRSPMRCAGPGRRSRRPISRPRRGMATSTAHSPCGGGCRVWLSRVFE